MDVDRKESLARAVVRRDKDLAGGDPSVSGKLVNV